MVSSKVVAKAGKNISTNHKEYNMKVDIKIKPSSDTEFGRLGIGPDQADSSFEIDTKGNRKNSSLAKSSVHHIEIAKNNAEQADSSRGGSQQQNQQGGGQGGRGR